MQDIADHRAGRRGDDADRTRQVGQKLLARRVEQSLGFKPLLALFKQRHQRAEPGGSTVSDHDLILRAARIGGQPSGEHHFKSGLKLELDARGGAAPDHAGNAGALVLEIEIDVAVRVIAHLAEFAADPHVAVGVLDRALELRRQFGDGQFRQIEARLVHRAIHWVHSGGRSCAASGPSGQSGAVSAIHRARTALRPRSAMLGKRHPGHCSP